MFKEFIWIIVCCLLTAALMMGMIVLENIDITQVRLADTYFAFNSFTFVLPVFLILTAVIYLLRGMMSGFVQLPANLILVVFSLAIAFISFQRIYAINQTIQGGWVIYPPLNTSDEDQFGENILASSMETCDKPLMIYLGIFWTLIALSTLIKMIKLKMEKGKYSGLHQT